MEFGNAQSIVNKHLEKETGLLCVTTVPKKRPDQFVRTIRTGGYRRDTVTDIARLTFECWNTQKTDAERDAQTIRRTLEAMRGDTFDGIKVHRIEEIAGPADSPDPDTGTPRYVFTHELALRGRYRKGQ